MSRHVDRLSRTVTDIEQAILRVSNAGSLDRLRRARDDINFVLRPVVVGTADRQRRVKRIVLAAENIDAWCPDAHPISSAGWQKGGSSSPVEVEDRLESGRLARQVIADRDRLTVLIAQLELLAAVIYRLTVEHNERLQLRRPADMLARWAGELSLLVVRNTETLHPDKLPTDASLPGCVSCGRPQQRHVKASGHFAPVAEPDPHAARRWGASIAESLEHHALCSFCRKHAVASAQDRGAPRVEVEDFPSLKAVDLLHRQGEQAAGRWLAKRLAVAS